MHAPVFAACIDHIQLPHASVFVFGGDGIKQACRSVFIACPLPHDASLLFFISKFAHTHTHARTHMYVWVR